jgi:hypothetical protein
MDLRENGVRMCGVYSYGLGQGSVASSCEHGNEPSVPHRGGEGFIK